MGSATNRNPARRLDDASSLAGRLEIRPRTAVVLVLLTLMVAVVGWRIARDTGARRVDVLAREAIGMFDAAKSTGTAAAPPDAAEASERFQALAGVPIGFPRDDVDFVPLEVRRETFANHPAASLRFRYAGEGYLLVVSARDPLLGTASVAAFPGGAFVSGERDGRSFVLWEREEATCIVVSEVDVTLAFDVVRRLFT
ncbi:hypothetical protein [Candidatus Deferrimicrobium sp.]|jgi:hypothetical protein|uniref:hypothetical protein n=1 Tax=Candidatus Deferrimicrobium sp. TaxID=3060586 RepID=UPI002ED90CC4